MENLKSAGLLMGRVLMGQIFLVSGVSKIFSFGQTAKYMSAHDMHAVYLWLVLAIIFEIAGALSLFAGAYTRIGALALILFMIPVTLIFHLEPGNRLQSIMLMKNAAITGGLLVILCCGPGKISLDWKRKKAG